MTISSYASLRMVLARSALLGWFLAAAASASEPIGAALPVEPPLSDGERTVIQQAQAARIAAIDQVYQAVVCPTF